jgi:RNA polymerase sigma-70 factor (sigma-E family)
VGDHRDPPGLVALCEELHPQLVGTLTLYCGNRAIAEELTQETLVRLWNRWEDVRSLDSPHGWAHRVAMNLANSWFRRRAAEWRANTRSRGVAATVEDPADVLALREAVGALPPRQRAAIVCRYYAGLSVAQTAAVLGCATGTVKSLTSKGIDSLRAQPGFDVRGEVLRGS